MEHGLNALIVPYSMGALLCRRSTFGKGINEGLVLLCLFGGLVVIKVRQAYRRRLVRYPVATLTKPCTLVQQFTAKVIFKHFKSMLAQLSRR